MLSDAVQKMIPKYKVNLPLNKKFVNLFFESQQLSIELNNEFNNFKVNKESGIISDNLSNLCRKEFDMLLNGQYSPEELVQDTMNVLMRKR